MLHTPNPHPPRDDLRFSNTTGILPPKKTMWFIGVEVEQETSAPPPKKILDPPLPWVFFAHSLCIEHIFFFCPLYELKHADLEGQHGLVEPRLTYAFVFVAKNHRLVVV